MCIESDPDALYPMLCSCSGKTSIEFIINSGLWWANLSMIILGLVCAVYAFVVSAYNAATKPTVEYLRSGSIKYLKI